jgi:hypothetical protein
LTDKFSDDVDVKLRYFLMDIPEAVALAYDLFFLTHFWDDLVDGDVPRTVEDIEAALRKQWVDIPGNRFFQVNEVVLRPMLARVALLWLDSNKLEKGDENDKFIAFNIRCDLVKVIHTMIILVGGPNWAQEVGVDFWRTFGPSLEDYNDFLVERRED